MKKLLAVALVLCLLVPCAYATDFSKMDDQGIESLLTVLEYFEPMTKEEIQQFTDGLRAEKEKRKAAQETSIKGSIIYEDEEMQLVLLDFYTQDNRIYGPLSIVKLQWLNKKNETLSRTDVFRIEQYQNGVQLTNGYLKECDSEFMTAVRGGATLTFYLVCVMKDKNAGVELVFDKPYNDYYNSFDDIIVKLW